MTRNTQPGSLYPPSQAPESIIISTQNHSSTSSSLPAVVLAKAVSLILILILSLQTAFSQGIRPDTVWVKQGRELPCVLKETSGLAFADGILWSFNDSGGKPVLYGVDPSSGKVVRKIMVNADNSDWESISYGPDGFWIADIGNNWGLRNDQELRLIQPKLSGENKVKLDVIKKIGISFPETRFPRADKNDHNRDCEAVSHYRDKLVLFTKNRHSPDSYIAFLEKDKPTQEVNPVDTLKTGMLITSADYHPERDLMVLTGYTTFRNFLFFIPDFSNDSRRTERMRKYHLQGMDGAQVEGVSFTGDDYLYISTEKTRLIPQQIFQINYQRLVLPTGMRPEVCLKTGVTVKDLVFEPSGDSFSFSMNNKTDKGKVKAELVDVDGKKLARLSPDPGKGNALFSDVSMPEAKWNLVFLRLTNEAKEQYTTSIFIDE